MHHPLSIGKIVTNLTSPYTGIFLMHTEEHTTATTITEPLLKTIEWSRPIPLTPILSSDIAYPIDALPSSIQKAISIYQQYGQQPLPLIACSALGNISLACQSLANVARDNYLTGPISLYFLLASGSGTRKTAADTVFSKAIRTWETTIKQNREPDLRTAIHEHQAWLMQKNGLLKKIKRDTADEIDVSNTMDLLDQLIQNEPEIPLLPTLFFEDSTHEALAMHLNQGWPSGSLWSDEAGVILGSHSMQSSPTRFVALLNHLWDGKTFSTHRKTTKSFTLQNRRLTINLMMQPLLFEQMIRQSLGINRQSGFLARCLIAYPRNVMGNRFYQEPPSSLDCLADYEQRITDCLNQSANLTHKGCVNLPLLKMDTQAKRQWILFFNATESGLADNGQWSNIADFASKASENVARLAALFHLFEGRTGDINAENIEQSIQVIQWHLQEAQRLLATESIGNELTHAKKLMAWLINKGKNKITARDIQRLSGLRDKKQRDDAIEILIEHNILRMSKEDGKTFVNINPYCL